MPKQTSSTDTPMRLLSMTHGLIIQQALYCAAKLGVADLLKDGPQTSSELARDLKVNEPALFRILRLLASQSVFEETSPRTFANTDFPNFCAPACLIPSAPFSFSGEVPSACRR